MHITIVGTGYVGLVTGTCLASTGNIVTCLDVDEEKIKALRAGICPIYEPGLEELIRRNLKAGRLHFTTDKNQAYQSGQVIFICVGTPADEEGHPDLRYVMEAAADIGKAIEAGPGPVGSSDPTERRAKIIVVKSTVPVGTNAKVKAEIAKYTRKPFHMASNPEFLKEGNAVADFMKPDRVVIGIEDPGTGERLKDLYEPFVRQGNPIFIMDIPSAEMVKYASNAMLAAKISFINEIARLCEAYGADIDKVRLGMCADRRIGNQFLFPGLGYGGSCFPKDVLAMVSMGKAVGMPPALLSAVHQVNQQQRKLFIQKIDLHFSGRSRAGAAATLGTESIPPADLSGKLLAVWGLAFKPGTDDIREAPALTVIQELLQRGARISAYDPAAHENCRKALPDHRIAYADDPLSALNGAHALVICTEWDEFRHPDFDMMKKRMAEPVIFDGRNLYRPEVMQQHGFAYYSIGRRPVFPV